MAEKRYCPICKNRIHRRVVQLKSGYETRESPSHWRRRKYCSMFCRDESYSRNPSGAAARGRIEIKKECAVCHKTFQRGPNVAATNFRQRKTCSHRCQCILIKATKLIAQRELARKLDRLASLERLVSENRLEIR